MRCILFYQNWLLNNRPKRYYVVIIEWFHLSMRLTGLVHWTGRQAVLASCSTQSLSPSDSINVSLLYFKSQRSLCFTQPGAAVAAVSPSNTAVCVMRQPHCLPCLCFVFNYGGPGYHVIPHLGQETAARLHIPLHRCQHRQASTSIQSRQFQIFKISLK